MDVIAERQLELRKDSGLLDVWVKVGRPEPGPSGVDWVCPYEIWFGENCKSMAMHGIDSIQALELTIATLDVELEYATKQSGGQLYHYDEPFISMLENSGLVEKAK